MILFCCYWVQVIMFTEMPFQSCFYKRKIHLKLIGITDLWHEYFFLSSDIIKHIRKWMLKLVICNKQHSLKYWKMLVSILKICLIRMCTRSKNILLEFTYYQKKKKNVSHILNNSNNNNNSNNIAVHSTAINYINR